MVVNNTLTKLPQRIPHVSTALMVLLLASWRNLLQSSAGIAICCKPSTIVAKTQMEPFSVTQTTHKHTSVRFRGDAYYFCWDDPVWVSDQTWELRLGCEPTERCDWLRGTADSEGDWGMLGKERVGPGPRVWGGLPEDELGCRTHGWYAGAPADVSSPQTCWTAPAPAVFSAYPPHAAFPPPAPAGEITPAPSLLFLLAAKHTREQHS